MDAYLVCAQSDILQDGSCANPHWVAAPMLIPPMDLQAGVTISLAIIGLWAVAWVWRQL